MIISPMNVTLIDSMGSDLSVVNAARVSFNKESDWEETHLKESDAKLINYLAKHGHWTPFGHGFLSFRIKAPIFVARQLVKHQVGLCWNEVSRRYVNDEPEFWFPDVWRGKPVNAKQGSSDVVHTEISTEYWEGPIKEDALRVLGLARDFYQALIDTGVAPEQARMVLPLNCHTEWIWSGSLAAFARVCNLRICAHAQAETREVAEKIHSLVPDCFTHSWAALTNNCDCG